MLFSGAQEGVSAQSYTNQGGDMRQTIKNASMANKNCL